MASCFERVADRAETARPGQNLGYIAVVSALELDHLDILCKSGEIAYTDNDYLAARYGGVLTPNEGGQSWSLVGHG